MFEVRVTREFAAAHALTIGGEREPLHGHNWRVTATVAGPDLDGDGLLCDFHEVERALEAAVAPLHNRDLTDAGLFRRVNPSAENVARVIGDELVRRLAGRLPSGAHVTQVEVTEAPGCSAVHRRETPA